MAVFAGSDLKKWRESQGMSAADLAERISCDTTTLYRYESGKLKPNPDVMFQICEALGDIDRWTSWMRTEYPTSYVGSISHPGRGGKKSSRIHYRYGRDIRNKIMLQQTNQIAAMTESQAQTYMNDYESSTSYYTSDDWANDWSDYIYDQQEYTTVDGDTIKASTSYDAVFQNGDEFYFGSVGSAPDGWTQLTPN